MFLYMLLKHVCLYCMCIYVFLHSGHVMCVCDDMNSGNLCSDAFHQGVASFLMCRAITLQLPRLQTEHVSETHTISL